MKQTNRIRQSTRYLLSLFLLILVVSVISTCGGGGGGGGGGNSNTPPVANAGRDMKAINNALFVLDGSLSSDPDGHPLTCNWSIVSRPPGSMAILSNPYSVSPTITIDEAGPYSITLVVNDGISSSTTDTVNITALASISHIHDTGQNKCYDSAAEIVCPADGEAFFGQDAHYSTNPLRFTDNGSTVTDSITGLMWQKADSGTKYNWYQATGTFDATYNTSSTNVCGTLGVGGYSDWRLPSRRELVSIINYGQFPEGPDSSYFQSSGPDYWTSSVTVVSSDVAWGATGGRITYGFGSKGSSGLYVRCTRGPSWGQNSFVDNGNGTVTDTMSGLVWQQNDDGVARNWKDALSYCENLNFAGFSDWRMPDIKELESLVNINSVNSTNQMPAVDTTYFPTTHSGYYWSSTTYSFSGQLNFAWYVDFAFGWVDWGGDSKTDFNFTRCVR